MSGDYEKLRGKHIDDKFSNFEKENSKSNDKLDQLLQRLSTLEGYQKGKDDENKKWLTVIMWLIPTIISIISLYISIK